MKGNQTTFVSFELSVGFRWKSLGISGKPCIFSGTRMKVLGPNLFCKRMSYYVWNCRNL